MVAINKNLSVKKYAQMSSYLSLFPKNGIMPPEHWKRLNSAGFMLD